MDPSTAHHQEMMIMSSNHQSPSSASLENMLVCSNSTKSSSSQQQQQQDNNKKARPQPDQALKCPRCDSTNTKFCYYNNYSLSQPRYFCKSCRRYWTKGGTLRNVPVGGGCRKNKRSSSSSSAAAKINKSQDHPSGLAVVPINGLPPHLGYDANDLSLAFARLHKQQSNSSMGFDHHHHHQDDHHHFSMLAGGAADPLGNPSMMTSSAPGGGATTTAAFLDALRSNFMGTQNGNFIHNGFHSAYGFEQDHSGFQQQQHHQEQEQNMGMSFEDVSTTMKQENCSESRGDESSRVLWGFPWQQLSHGGSDHHLGLGSTTSHHELDGTAARESWNNSTNFTSAWHGLLNTPLH